MERFIVKEGDLRPMHLYYPNIEEARKHHPTAEITIDTDKEYLKLVERIKGKSVGNLYDYRGREIWKIPYNNDYILYRQYKDENGNYIDGCMYQRQDNTRLTTPLFWDMSTPKVFEEAFLTEKPLYDRENPTISQKELKKRKAKRFYSKNGKVYWKDVNGFFYTADKAALPNKVQKEEYERFKNNFEAVYVSYGSELAFRERGWFESKEKFIEFFNEQKKNHPPYMAELNYEILKRGYKKLPPEDRKIIAVMPYIDIDMEIKFAKRETANQNIVSRAVAKVWCNQMNGIKFFGTPGSNVDWVEDIVKKYMEFMTQ